MKNKPLIFVALLAVIAAGFWWSRQRRVQKYGYAASGSQASILDRLMAEREAGL